MNRAEFDDQPLQVYAALEKADRVDMLDAIDDAVDLLESDPSSAEARRRSFTSGVWGISLRTRSHDWLLLWEHDDEDPGIVVVRYIGEDPFAEHS